jgi:hypothetical protein
MWGTSAWRSLPIFGKVDEQDVHTITLDMNRNQKPRTDVTDIHLYKQKHPSDMTTVTHSDFGTLLSSLISHFGMPLK